MEQQMRFRTGDRQPFVVTRNFTLGASGITVAKGTELAFDGSTVEYGGQELSFPQLRGAIKQGWVVPAAAYDEDDPTYGRPQRANIQVRHATQGGNPMGPQPKMAIATVENDEREVMNARQHAQQTRDTNRNHVRGNPVNPVAAGERVRTQHGFEVVEQQDGVEVPGRTLKTAAGERAKSERTTLTAESAMLALQQAREVPPIEPGRGMTQEEMLERMDPDAREEYLARKESLRAQYVDEPVRTVVGKVQHQGRQTHTEGMHIRSDVGHGIEVADPTGLSTGKARESVIVEDGITFRVTNGSDKHTRPATNERVASLAPARPEAPPEVRKRIAKAVCADFPDNYDFAVPVKKRMARLQADYENRPDVIQAVFAAEGDEMKSFLMEEFPQAFAG